MTAPSPETRRQRCLCDPLMPNFDANPGLTTDLLLHAGTGVVEKVDDYVVVRTPETPEYFFGNLLVLPQRPSASDAERIERDFARLVGTPPHIAHRAFTWAESNEGRIDLDVFVARGYGATVCRVLTARPGQIRAVVPNEKVEVRTFRSQEDWEVWSAMQLADMPNPLETTSQRFMAHQQRVYKRLIERGLGDWWGAFIDGEQVGSLGLFFLDGMGRFQWVITSERHRNKRVCRTLVSAVLKLTADRARAFVMVADEAHHAGKIYEALGFEPCARMASLCWEPR